MSAPAPALRRFFRTPKGLLLLILAILIGLAAPGEGLRVVGPGLLGAAAGAMLVDAPILRWREGAWQFPSGALLTGLIVAMVMSPNEPWTVTTITAVVGVVSKYVFRTRSANVFNPAALALVATFYLFDTGQSWWGALPDLPPVVVAVVLVAGFFIADRVNKLPMVLVFLGTYYLLFTATAFAGDPGRVAEIYRAPDLHAVLFFAFFILTDPPTSPTRYRDQAVCAAIVAVVSYAVFEWVGAAYYLLAGVLVGNLWEAARRYDRRMKRSLVAATAAFVILAPVALVQAQAQKETVDGIRNFTRVDATVACAGATEVRAIPALAARGYKAIINLRLASETGANIDETRAAAEAAGIRFIHLPFNGSQPDPTVVDAFLKAVTDPANQPVFINCGSANRVGAMWLVKRRLVDKWDEAKAVEEARTIGLTGAALEKFALEYVRTHGGVPFLD